MEKYKSKVVEKVESKGISHFIDLKKIIEIKPSLKGEIFVLIFLEVSDTRWEIFPPQGSILGSCAMMSAHGTFLR